MREKSRDGNGKKKEKARQLRCIKVVRMWPTIVFRLSCRGLLTVRKCALCVVAGVSASERTREKKGKKRRRNETKEKKEKREEEEEEGEDWR